jgi:type I site-specific restriction endonuclease
MITEADTCRKYVLPKLYAAGWNDDQINEQKSFTDGRIVVVGDKARRRPSKRADYLLRYARDFMLAVVEAKAAYKLPGDGLQQAKEYAEVLGLRFANSTNGHGIIEFDYTTGREQELKASRRQMNSGSASVQQGKLRTKRQRTNFSLLPMRLTERASATIKKSPSTASSKLSCKAISGYFSQWRLEPEKPRWRSRSAGSSGACAGIGRENTAAPRFFTSPIEIS